MVTPVDHVVTHHLVFTLGVERLPRDSFFGFGFLVGLLRGVVLTDGRRGGRHHDHGRPLGRVDFFDGLLDAFFFGEVPNHLVSEGGPGNADHDEHDERVANESC